MKYIGIQTQKSRNNFRSLLLLVLFPILVLLLVYIFLFLLLGFSSDLEINGKFSMAFAMLLEYAPVILGCILIWFVIAYFANTSIISSATGSHSLSRKDNKRVYNLVENLCMSIGMKMPRVNVIEDSSLNAFASGINEKTYCITLTRGIINELDDDELEGVIAHELSHIRNSDVRLLIVSIVFVGIFAMIAQLSLNMIRYSSIARSSRNNKNGGGMVIILLLLALVAGLGYVFSSLMRFAISRKREYLADAAASELTRKPLALAGALRKISGNSTINSLKREDVAQLFIDHSSGKSSKRFWNSLTSLFATHPPIEKRIEILEQF